MSLISVSISSSLSPSAPISPPPHTHTHPTPQFPLPPKATTAWADAATFALLVAMARPRASPTLHAPQSAQLARTALPPLLARAFVPRVALGRRPTFPLRSAAAHVCRE